MKKLVGLLSIILILNRVLCGQGENKPGQGAPSLKEIGEAYGKAADVTGRGVKEIATSTGEAVSTAAEKVGEGVYSAGEWLVKKGAGLYGMEVKPAPGAPKTPPTPKSQLRPRVQPTSPTKPPISHTAIRRPPNTPKQTPPPVVKPQPPAPVVSAQAPVITPTPPTISVSPVTPPTGNDVGALTEGASAADKVDVMAVLDKLMTWGGQKLKTALGKTGYSLREVSNSAIALSEDPELTPQKTLFVAACTLWFFILARMVVYCQNLTGELNGTSYYHYPWWTGPLAGFRDFGDLSWRKDSDEVKKEIKESWYFRSAPYSITPVTRTWNYKEDDVRALNTQGRGVDRDVFIAEAKKDLATLENFRRALVGSRESFVDRGYYFIWNYSFYLPLMVTDFIGLGRVIRNIFPLIGSTVRLIDKKKKYLEKTLLPIVGAGVKS